MSNKILSSIDFGKKLYNTLPPSYRTDDALVDYSLERFLSALSDGGFSKVIEEINDLLTLVDPDKVKAELLPILFKNYGMDIFNGIPEVYLRKLLPMVSELYALKGTKTSVEYLTSIISGVKSTIEYDEEFSENHALNVRLEMDYEAEGNEELPDREQLVRIIKEFVPFFCDVVIVYVYLFSESCKVTMREFGAEEVSFNPNEDTPSFANKDILADENAIFGIGCVFGEAVFGNDDYELKVEHTENSISFSNNDTPALSREESNPLSDSEKGLLGDFSLNNISICDKIVVNGVTTIVYSTPTQSMTIQGE